MAEESPIAKLAAKPLKFQLAVLAGALLAVVLIYYQVFYSDLNDQLQTAKDDYTRLEKDLKKAKTREREWEQMVKDKEKLDRELSANQVSLPATSSVTSFIEHLQSQAAVAGVTYENVKRQKEIPVVGYVKVPVAIEVVGTFHQVLRYFYLLGKTKRIITVENFSLKPEKSKGAEDVLRATFQATTFRQEDGARPAPTAAPKSGMINKVKGAKEKREAQVEAATGEKGGASGAAKSGVNRLKTSGAK